MTIFLTNAFRMNPLHTGYILSFMFKLVYRGLKAVKIYFARAVSSLQVSGTLLMNIIRLKNGRPVNESRKVSFSLLIIRFSLSEG